MLCSSTRQQKKSVGVIGGGAAGLVAARELRRLNHDVVVLEQGSEVGGVWVYDPQTERQFLQTENTNSFKNNQKVHSSMYKNLRTNLPREIMAFSDFPFHPQVMAGKSIDDRRYPCHQEVLVYLQTFADQFELRNLVKLQQLVTNIEAVNYGNGGDVQWNVQFQDLRSGVSEEMVLDAIVICNGHYSTPHLPRFQGLEKFQGKLIHSHDYRTQQEFAGERVVVIGKGPSGVDIAFEVSEVAKKVFISARGWKQKIESKPINKQQNLYQKQNIQEFTGPHSLSLVDGEVLEGIDTVLLCTGYDFNFPFLQKINQHFKLVDEESGKMMPLYKQMFVPSFGSSLSFIGLPFNIVPFPLFEYQCKWVARLLGGECAPLPSTEHMEQQIKIQMAATEFQNIQQGIVQYYDMSMSQFAYLDWLSEQCMDTEQLPKWREAMFHATRPNKYTHPETYRDNWSDFELVQIAKKHNLQQIESVCKSQNAICF